MYCTSWCADCHRAKRFLTERGVQFTEINIDEDVDAEDLVIQVNDGRRKSADDQGRRAFFFRAARLTPTCFPRN